RVRARSRRAPPAAARSRRPRAGRSGSCRRRRAARTPSSSEGGRSGDREPPEPGGELVQWGQRDDLLLARRVYETADVVLSRRGPLWEGLVPATVRAGLARRVHLLITRSKSHQNDPRPRTCPRDRLLDVVESPFLARPAVSRIVEGEHLGPLIAREPPLVASSK